MLGCVPLTLLEFREVLNDPLHIFDRIELRLAFFVNEELIDKTLNLLRQVAKVSVHHFPEENVILTRQHHFFHFL